MEYDSTYLQNQSSPIFYALLSLVYQSVFFLDTVATGCICTRMALLGILLCAHDPVVCCCNSWMQEKVPRVCVCLRITLKDLRETLNVEVHRRILFAHLFVERISSKGTS